MSGNERDGTVDEDYEFYNEKSQAKSKKVAFDILGVCVSRDVFGLANGNEYAVGKYTRLSIPYFSDMEEVDPECWITMDEVSGERNFHKRLKLDCLNMRYAEDLNSSGSDWLLLDVRTLTFGYFETKFGGKTHYYIGEKITEDEIRTATRKKGFEPESIRFLDTDDVPGIDGMIDRFCEFIKGRYWSNIIILEMKDALWHVDKEGKTGFLHDFPVDRRRRITGKYTEILRKKLGCRCIPMPSDVICDYLHLWGMSKGHFVQEYYDYAYRCVDAIVKGADDLDLRLETEFLEACAAMDAIRSGRMLSRNNTVRRAEEFWARTGDADASISNAQLLMAEANNPPLEAELAGIIGRIWRDRTDGKADAGKAASWMRAASDGGIAWASEELEELGKNL